MSVVKTLSLSRSYVLDMITNITLWIFCYESLHTGTGIKTRAGKARSQRQWQASVIDGLYFWWIWLYISCKKSCCSYFSPPRLIYSVVTFRVRLVCLCLSVSARVCIFRVRGSLLRELFCASISRPTFRCACPCVALARIAIRQKTRQMTFDHMNMFNSVCSCTL